MTKTDIVCTVFGSTIGLWIHAVGSQLAYTILVGGLSGFSAWYGTQFAKFVWRHAWGYTKNVLKLKTDKNQKINL